MKGQARAAVAQACLLRRRGVLAHGRDPVELEFTAEVLQIALDEGATTINVPDTVGYSTPDEHAEMWRTLYRLVPGLAEVTTSVTATTTSGWRWPTPSPGCWWAAARWSARSTASASVPATRRWRR